MSVPIQNVDTKTYPCVFHHAGGDSLCRTGLELKRQFFELIGEPHRYFHSSKNGRISGLETDPFAICAEASTSVRWTS